MGNKIWHIGVSREDKKYIIFSEKTDSITLHSGFEQVSKGYKTKEGALSAVKVRFPSYKLYTENKNSISKSDLSNLLTSTAIKHEDIQVESVDSVKQSIVEVEDIDVPDIKTNDKSVFCAEDYLIHKILRLDVNTLRIIFNYNKIALVCVDGAYKPETGKTGYAYAIVADGEIYTDSGLVKLDKSSSTKIEMVAVKHALSKILALGINEVFLVHDCAYVTGVFEVKNIAQCCSETKEYLKFIDLVSKVINIHWVKVKGHSGIPIHTQVDVAAGMCVGRTI